MKKLPYLACRTNNLVYLNVPKSACTTTKNVMHFLDTKTWLADPLSVHFDSRVLIGSRSHPKQLLRILSSGNRFCFTFIRAPDRRVYSCFVEKICATDHKGYMAVRDLLTHQYNLRFDENPEADLDNHRRNFLAFLQFVNMNLAENSKIRGKGHWQRQSAIIRRGQELPPQFIGLVEKFKPHFNHVLREAGIDYQFDVVPQFNESTAKSVKFDAIDNDEVQAAIRDVYKADFDLYDDVKHRTKDIV